MAYRVIAGFVLIGALATAPVFATDDGGQRRRDGSDRQGNRSAQQAPRGDAQGRDRAVPRSENQGRQNDNVQRQNQVQRQNDNVQRQQAQRQNDNVQRQQAQRQNDNVQRQQVQRQNDNAQRQYQAQRQYETQRQNQSQRQYAVPRNNGVGRDYGRPSYSNRGYGYGNGYGYSSRAPRIIRPTIVTVVPYRPDVYRPRFGIGVYYGAGGSYPYGYTPRGYYDPLPGRYYGGLRIVGAPRDAQVFADGYYVGIVDDFDGIFQHVNLEAGAHQIEIRVPGYEPIAFDVMVQPGRTTTFRADVY